MSHFTANSLLWFATAVASTASVSPAVCAVHSMVHLNDPVETKKDTCKMEGHHGKDKRVKTVMHRATFSLNSDGLQLHSAKSLQVCVCLCLIRQRGNLCNCYSKINSVHHRFFREGNVGLHAGLMPNWFHRAETVGLLHSKGCKKLNYTRKITFLYIFVFSSDIFMLPCFILK